jgi:hypothetical protein
MGVGRVFFDMRENWVDNRGLQMPRSVEGLKSKEYIRPNTPLPVSEYNKSLIAEKLWAQKDLMRSFDNLEWVWSGIKIDTKGAWLKMAMTKVESAKSNLEWAQWVIDQSKQDLQKLRHDRLITKFSSLGQDPVNTEKLANEYMAVNKDRWDLLRMDATKNRDDRKAMYKKWFDEFLSAKWIEKPVEIQKNPTEVGPIDITDPKNNVMTEEAKKTEEFYQKEEEEIAKLRAAQFEHEQAEKTYVQATQDYQQAVVTHEAESTQQTDSRDLPIQQVNTTHADPESVWTHPLTDIVPGVTDKDLKVYIAPDGTYTMIDPDTGKIWNAANKEEFTEMYGYYNALNTPLESIQNMWEDRAMMTIRELGKMWSSKMNSKMTPEHMRSMIILALARWVSSDQWSPMEVSLSDIASGWTQYKTRIAWPLTVWDSMSRFMIATREKWFFTQENTPNMNTIFDAVSKISG